MTDDNTLSTDAKLAKLVEFLDPQSSIGNIGPAMRLMFELIKEQRAEIDRLKKSLGAIRHG